MRTSIIKITLLALMTYAGGVLAIDFTEHEKTCSELGFKKRTPAFGECVLELDRRMTTNEKANAVRLQAEEVQASRDRVALEQKMRALEQKTREEAVAMRGDGTPDHETCRRYGFTPQTPDYAQCRLKIDQFRQQAQSQQQEYQSQLAAQQRARESRQGEALLRLGLGLMGGSPRSAAPAPSAVPQPPQRFPQNIFLPGGRSMTCIDNGSVVDCR